MATADQYAEWIVANQDKRGTPEFDTVAAAYKEAKGTPAPEKNLLEKYSDYAIGNTVGAVRGAADIGNTLLNASTFIPRKIASLTGDNSLENLNSEREASLDSWTKANQDRPGFTTGRIGANIAGTSGVGKVLGATVEGLSQAPRALQFAEALRTGGMSAGGAGMGTRALGGAITGGVSAGLVDPESADTGAVVGAVMPAAIKGAYALGKSATSGAKSLAEPFYQGGREQILGRALRSAAGNQADDALLNLQNAKPLVPGSQPTAGMVAQNPGIAALERASVANNPVATNELAIRQAANNDARLAAIEGIIPDRPAAIGARETATQGLYNQSSQSPVQMTPELQTLLNRPSMQSAISRAEKLAGEAGEIFDINNLNGRTAQYLKMSLDDIANSGPMTGIGGNELRSIQATRSQFIDELGKQIPEYLQANKAYAELSQPLNQADIIDEVLSKSRNFRGDLTPAALARNLSDKTAQRVAGNPNASLIKALKPEQLDTLNNVRQDLLNQDFAQTAGRGVGSNTVQNLAYTNMLDQFGVPTGLRGMAPVGTVGNIIGRAGDVAYKRANERLAAELAEALLDPQKAAEVMLKAQRSGVNPKLIEALQIGAGRSAPLLSTREHTR
jgi:hypothetical protein